MPLLCNRLLFLSCTSKNNTSLHTAKLWTYVLIELVLAMCLLCTEQEIPEDKENPSNKGFSVCLIERYSLLPSPEENLFVMCASCVSLSFLSELVIAHKLSFDTDSVIAPGSQKNSLCLSNRT